MSHVSTHSTCAHVGHWSATRLRYLPFTAHLTFPPNPGQYGKNESGQNKPNMPSQPKAETWISLELEDLQKWFTHQNLQDFTRNPFTLLSLALAITKQTWPDKAKTDETMLKHKLISLELAALQKWFTYQNLQDFIKDPFFVFPPKTSSTEKTKMAKKSQNSQIKQKQTLGEQTVLDGHSLICSVISNNIQPLALVQHPNE